MSIPSLYTAMCYIPLLFRLQICLICVHGLGGATQNTTIHSEMHCVPKACIVMTCTHLMHKVLFELPPSRQALTFALQLHEAGFAIT